MRGAFGPGQGSSSLGIAGMSVFGAYTSPASGGDCTGGTSASFV